MKELILGQKEKAEETIAWLYKPGFAAARFKGRSRMKMRPFFWENWWHVYTRKVFKAIYSPLKFKIIKICRTKIKIEINISLVK